MSRHTFSWKIKSYTEIVKQTTHSLLLDDGINAAYLEKISNDRREECFDEGARNVIMNMELAGFGDGGCLKRFMTEVDKRVDRVSVTPGARTYENIK